MHFVKFIDDSIFSQGALLLMYLRGAGIIHEDNEAAVDLILPVSLSPDHPTRETMTAILIRLRLRRSVGSKSRFSIDAQPLYLCSDTVKPSTTPYVSLVLDLATDWVCETPAVCTRPIIPPPDDPGSPYCVQPRYAIFAAHGCSSSVYANMTLEQSEQYALMIAKSRSLFDYPHEADAARTTLLSMTPFFAGGVNSFHWAELEDEPRSSQKHSHKRQKTPLEPRVYVGNEVVEEEIRCGK